MLGRIYKYYDLVMAAFVTILFCSNVIGAAKVATIPGWADQKACGREGEDYYDRKTNFTPFSVEV